MFEMMVCCSVIIIIVLPFYKFIEAQHLQSRYGGLYQLGTGGAWYQAKPYQQSVFQVMHPSAPHHFFFDLIELLFLKLETVCM